MVFNEILIIVTLCIPLPSYQHFVWPPQMCLLADICNHTWIPECGKDVNTSHLRLFIDECDMFEYNCDYEKYHEPVNYSDCFGYMAGCPTQAPCPSNPTCPNHRFHRAGDHYIYVSQARRMLHRPTLRVSLPQHMLHGKRRYTPKPKRKSRKTVAAKKINKNKCSYSTTKLNGMTKPMIRYSNKPMISQIIKRKDNMVILRKETVIKNGRRWIKVVKGRKPQTKSMNIKANIIKKDSDFLE